MYRKLFSHVREYAKYSWITVLLIVVEAALEAAMPFITAEMINTLQSDTGTMGDIFRTGAVLVSMAVASLACGALAAFTAARASTGFVRNLRHDMFVKIQSFSFENIDRFSSSSLVTRLTTDLFYIRMSYMMIIRLAIRAPLLLTFAIVMAFIMGGKMAFSFVVLVPVLAFSLIMIAKFAMPAFHAVFKKYDRMNEAIEENVEAMRVVKGFAREEYEQKKFGRASDEIAREFTKAERIVALESPIFQLCIYSNMIFVLLMGSKLIISTGGTALNLGHISGLLTYGMQVLMQLLMLSMIYVTLTISAESFRRVSEVLDEESTLKNPENPVTEVRDGSVDFCHVSFKYSKDAERNALEDADLHIRSGMTVGILGGTGSAKSTLVQLIPRLYDVTEGQVLVGGVDVRDYDMEVLRENVAMVLQKNLLFSGTVRDNIKWGNPDATDEEVAEACRMACADEFITAHAEGYDRKIEQGGTNVSGGQKQRLCIARALLRKPKILILDDSTSAVDMKTDAKIRAAFRSYIPETTKIIIAQRVASVQDADLIVVMDNGKIVATGTHGQLLESNGIYRETFLQQTGGNRDE